MPVRDLILAYLPHLNALLNLSAATLLGFGYYYILRKRIRAHRLCMNTALILSAAFLASYLVYHFYVGKVPFSGTGMIRLVYFGLLASHVILAIVNLPMVAMVVVVVHNGRIDQHIRLARWTLIIWAYVSVSGLIIYSMVFHIYSG